jgi:hypothetical protein
VTCCDIEAGISYQNLQSHLPPQLLEIEDFKELSTFR